MEQEKRNPVKIATPPKFGIMRLWILRDSFGSSNNRFLKDTVMIGGIAKATTKRLVR